MAKNYCIVPLCFNSTVKTPDKLFFYVPHDPKIRKKWMTAVSRVDTIGPKTAAHCCEDHFDVENDMENYIKYKLVGGILKLRKGVVPHKFSCQKQPVVKPGRSGVKIHKIAKLITSSSECIAPISHDVEEKYTADSIVTRDENLRTTEDILKTKHSRHRTIAWRNVPQIKTQPIMETKVTRILSLLPNQEATCCNNDPVVAISVIAESPEINRPEEDIQRTKMATTEPAKTSQRKGTELEKFKRRMIRSVARRIKEKKSDEELWNEMKKEIGSNCKKLWTRMRMLTLKKLKRLLEADDRAELIGPVARMTLTDWLLFDLVIVHEKIDVIGREVLSSDYKCTLLNNLFSLVQRFEIEGRSGENLAEAWTAATVYYNSKGHQCSPMMLQRRWFQLKELTRHKFYKFWFNYRGNQRQLITAKQDSPDELQKAIALRYPQIITKKFLTWEEGIEERLVILPDELGVKMRQRNLMKPSDTSAPDVVLIEPHVETIDLGNISDSEDEDEHNICDTQPVVKVKSEPIDLDESVDQEEFQIPPEKGSEFEEEIERLQMAEENFDEESHNAEHSEDVVMDPGRIDSVNSPCNIANEPEDTNVVNNVTDDSVILIDDGDEFNPKENSSMEKTEMAMTGNAEEGTVTYTNREERIEEESNEVIMEISSVTSVGIKVENIDDVIERDRTVEEVEMLPVISTVSSAGIKVELDMEIPKEMCIDNVVPMSNIEDEGTKQSDVTEVFPVISTISSKGVKIEVEIEPINKKKKFFSEHETVDKPTESIVNKNDDIIDEEFDDDHIFNIADDRIEFADDGIAYVEDDEDDIITLKDPSSSDIVKTETESKLTDDEEDQDDESDQEQEDAQKFDLKLLMQPVVYTTKLDTMPVFDDASEYTQVYNKETIDKIYALSKPYSKQSETSSEQVNIAEKTDTKDDINLVEVNDTAVSDDDLFSNEVENSSDNKSTIDDSKRVKLSSYMLQKPKHRSYNPVLLCKNPDFNTRLKKLTVGFFMSARNRTLLQSCIPMTIDMSKAFENKLIDGTLYLKKSNDATFVNKQDVEVTSASLVKPTTVQQSLMSIDDTLENELKQRMAERVRAINLPDISQVRRLNQHLLTAEVTPLRTQDKLQNQTKLRRAGPACYIQNLKDDINNLLTKQKAIIDSNLNPIVTKMQVYREIAQPQPDIAPQPQVVQPQPQVVQPQPQIIQPQPQIIQPQPQIIQPQPKIAQPPPQVVQPQPTTPMVTIHNPNPIIEPTILISILSQNSQKSNDPQSATSAAPKPRKPHRKSVYPTLAWNRRPFLNNPPNQEIHHSDALLTIDTLYKMLSALDPNLKKNAFNPNQKTNPKQKVNEAANNKEDKKNEKTTEKKNAVIDITEDEAPKKPKGRPCRTVDPSSKTVRLKDRKYCCWSSYKLDYFIGNLSYEESRRRHKCKANACICCCRDSYMKKISARKTQVTVVRPVEIDQSQQISLAIESVIDKTKLQTKPQTQTCDASVQIDLDNTQESVSDLSLSNAVLTRTSDTVGVTSQSSSNDSTAELTPLSLSPTKMPKIRVYTATKKLDKPVSVPAPSIKRPQNEIIRQDFTEKCKKYMENKELYLQRLLDTEMTTENKSAIKKPVLYESKVCTCRPHISKVNQGHIEINGKTSCAVHKKQIKQNKIIMNKKLFSNNNQPFFVGKGKILLTNVRMPNKDTERTLRVSPIVEKTAPVDQPNEVQTFSLPAGVQVLLLPDQTLTYVIQPDIVLTPEECAILPQFLVAIQQQINAVGITLPTSHPNTITNEVIDLDDDKSSNEPNTPNENVTKVVENVDNLPSESMPISEGKKSTEEAKTDENCIMEIDDISGQKEAPPGDDEKDKKNKEPILSGENIEIRSSNENPESKSSDTALNNPAEGDANSKNKEPMSSADEAANKKSLLSELMEMSGIMEEDLAPAPPVVATPPGPIILDTQNFVLQRQVPRDELTTQTLETPEPPAPKQHYTATNKHGTFELVAVTSFAELKFACDNNGVFFKLDLDTGSLTSINVCIQKFPGKIKPTTDTTMIDLTDDPDISITGASEGDSPTNQHSLVLNEVEDQSSPNKTPISRILLKKQRLMDRLSNNLKPINLQQSKKHVARILKGSKTLHRKPEFRFYSKNKLEKIEAKIDLVDSDAPMEEEYLVNSEESSDDEPLIKKVKRKLIDEPICTSGEPNQTADEQKKLALMTCSENEENSELDRPVQNTSIQDQSNVKPEQQNKSNPETNVQRGHSNEENLPDSQEGNDEYEANDQEEFIEQYEDLNEESHTEAVPTDTYPVPTNLVLSGGASKAHNIPLNMMYQEGDEAQDEDCILGV